MQISDILNRMTAKERRALAQHRLGIEGGTADVASLAAALAEPIVVTAALVRLNAAQLRILQWVVKQPDLTARWTDFVAVLGDRLPPELRDDYLLELRTQALADFDTTGDDGFIATYPAVRAVLPSSRRVDLHEYLNTLRADTLAQIVSLQDVTERPTRKEERIARLVQTLTTSESCQALLARRSAPARELFQWMIERGGLVDLGTLITHIPRSDIASRLYYLPDAWWTPKPSAQELKNPLAELVRCGLVCPVSLYQSSWYGANAYAIPVEVELASLGQGWFDRGSLQAPPLQPAQQGGGTVPDPAAVLRDVLHLLGYVQAGRCEFKQDGEPYKRSLTALGKLLGRSDAGYAELLWQLAVSAGLMRPSLSGDVPYTPVPMGKVSPHQLAVRILRGWIDGPHTAAPAYSPSRTPVARQNLLDLVRTVPPDTWMQQASLDEWLRFQRPMVFATLLRAGTAPSSDNGWVDLGALLVARGKDVDGSETVMVPAEQQHLLTWLAQPEPKNGGSERAPLPPWDTTWTVQADRLIVVPPNAHPDAVIALWKVAKLESNHGASLFRLSAESVAGALNLGLTPDAVRRLLESRSRVPLPPTVLRLIEDQGQRYGRIKVGTAMTYVKTDDPALLEELVRDNRLKKLKLRVIAPGVAVVAEQHQDAVIAVLRGAGQLPVPDAPAETATKAMAGVAAMNGTELAAPTESHKPLAPSAVRRLVREAIKAERSLNVIWQDGGERYSTEIAPIEFHGHMLHAYDVVMGEDIDVPVDALTFAALGGDVSDIFGDGY